MKYWKTLLLVSLPERYFLKLGMTVVSFLPLVPRVKGELNSACEVEASAPEATATQQPALHELDRSAAQIRTALARDPDARFLLERLRRTYSLRLALTQRAALS